MPAPERRSARRLIMKVPLRFRPVQAPADPEHEAASMNICNHGVYFATDRKMPEGGMVQIHLKMPREEVGEDAAEWGCTGRVAHNESLVAQRDKSGSGGHLLDYE